MSRFEASSQQRPFLGVPDWSSTVADEDGGEARDGEEVDLLWVPDWDATAADEDGGEA